LPLPQHERDNIDNEAVRDAWVLLTGVLPDRVEQRVSRGEVFYSALDLAEALIDSKNFAGWRVSFTTDGGPYTATLLLNNNDGKDRSEMTASHSSSLALAFITVIKKWAVNHS
jgi:hypothetical protein